VSSPSLAPPPRAPAGSAALRVEVHEGAEALEALDARWEALLDRQPLPSPTMLPDWLRSVRGPDRSSMVALVWSNGDLVGGGAFRRERTGPATVGTWLAGARFPGILVDPSVPAAGEAVIRAVLERCHMLRLPRTPAVGAAMPAIDAAAPWRSAVPVEPGGYAVELPPERLEHARGKAAYALRRAARRDAEVRTEIHADPEDVEAAVDRLAALYRARWSGREREGESYSDITVEPERYRLVLPVLAERGRVRIVEVLESERLVASTLGLLAGRGALFHTTATDPGRALRGPGHIAMLAWVEEAAAAGARAMYLGRGAGEPEGPKSRLGAHAISLADVLVASSPARQRAIGLGLAALHRVRQPATVIRPSRSAGRRPATGRTS
jgi:CelD/BcsL family acetyltransferase involved in cellulose biosynthesis